MKRLLNVDHRDVLIVGTGVAASIMAKQLSNYQYNTDKKSFEHIRNINQSNKQNFLPIRILLLEAGLEAGTELTGEKANTTHEEYLKKFDMEMAKVPNSPYYNLKAAPSPDVLDLPRDNDLVQTRRSSYLVQNGPMPFLSDAIRTGGGTTMHWLGSTPRMLPHDFKLKSTYGKAVDWPIEYNDFQKYYDFAEYELGVAGRDVDKNTSNQLLKEAYIKIENGKTVYHQFPMSEIPMSYSDNEIAKKLKRKTKTYTMKFQDKMVEISLFPTPQARNSFPNKAYNRSFKYQKNRDKEDYDLICEDNTKPYTVVGTLWDQYQGNRCEGNASCVPFCPAQAKYNALKTLKQALYKQDQNSKKLVRDDSVDIITQTVVYRLEASSKDGTIEKIYVKQYRQKEIEKNMVLDVEDRYINTSDMIVILATNAIENPKILLNSPFQEGRQIANASNQLGRNLMDHMVYLQWGYTQQPVYPFRGPGSTANISAFRDGKFRSKFAPFFGPIDNWGWAWPTFAPGSDLDNLLEHGIVGKGLKQLLGRIVERQILFKWEVEQLPDPNNNVTIDQKYVDALSIPRPVICYDISNYEKEAIFQARQVTKNLFKHLKIDDQSSYDDSLNSFKDKEGNVYAFKGAGHIVGTHRIGNDPSDSVTNSYCKSWEHPNLYLIGTGSMPTLGTSNPTLTMVALTLRSTESVLKDLTIKNY